MKPRTTAALTLLLASHLSHAQEADTVKTVELKPVTVTATRSEKDLMDAPRSVTVITAEDIRNSGANSIAEVLTQQEGIYIVGAGQNPGQLQSIYLRGANGNHTNILIDGVKISDPSTPDNAIDLSELSLAGVERIEIVRGSHGTLYGASAIGGVINIITKKSRRPGFHADAGVKAGTFGAGTSLMEQGISLNLTQKSGIYVSADVYNIAARGLDATVDTVTDENNYVHNNRDKDDHSKTDITGRIGYRNKEWDIYTSYRAVDQQSDIDDGAYRDDDNYTIGFKRNLVTYGASWKKGDKFSMAYTGGITGLVRDIVDDSTVVADDGTTDHSHWEATYKGSGATNEIVVNARTKGLDLVAGGGLFSEQMTFKTRYYSTTYGPYESTSNLDTLNIDVHTLSAFVHAGLDGSLITDSLQGLALGLGVRGTKHDLSGKKVTFEINPSYKVTDNSLLFVSYSTGFNTPSLYQLFSPDKDFTSGITRGNQTLKPEVSASWEFGFRQKLDRVTYSVSFFSTVVDNSIDYVYLWEKSTAPDALGYGDYRGDTYLNIGRQENHGMEVSVRSELSGKVSVFANVSVISGRLVYDPSDMDAGHTKGHHVQVYANGAFLDREVETVGLVRRPSTALAGIAYRPVRKLTLGATVKHTGARGDVYYSAASGPFGALATSGVAAYTLTDAVARYDAVENLSVALRVENIFDVTYSEIFGYATRGRSLYLSLRYSFSGTN